MPHKYIARQDGIDTNPRRPDTSISSIILPSEPGATGLGGAYGEGRKRGLWRREGGWAYGEQPELGELAGDGDGLATGDTVILRCR